MYSSNNPGDDRFDLETVLRATRTISSELDLGRLVTSIVESMVENVGAQKGHLILERGGQLCIEASATIEPSISPAPPGPVVDGSNLPESIIRYAFRTREVVLLDDATQEVLFNDDPYVLAEQPRSVICAPIRHADRTLGVVYLENNLAPRAFPPERVRVLTTLAAQAAISLENAQLYRTLAEEVSERTRAQDALKRLNEELEQRVEERTRELRASQAELLRNERLTTLGQLTASVSHELRNPFGTLVTSCYLVRKRIGGKDPKLRQALDRMERTVERCLRIIEQLVYFSRSDSAPEENVVLDEWLSGVLDNATLPATVQERRQLALGDCQITIDRDRLAHAVNNVIDNACQAMMPGQADDSPREGQLAVTTRCRGRIEIEVTDTGPGMQPGVLDHIFDPLYSTKSFGVGLGLSTTRKILEEHGGGVEVTSEVGEGTQVTLWLPLGTKTAEHESR